MVPTTNKKEKTNIKNGISDTVIPFYWSSNSSVDDMNTYFQETINDQIPRQSVEKIEGLNPELIFMRKTIIEWIIFINKKLSFKNETIFKFCEIFDQYLMNSKEFILQCENIKKRLQLVAVVCLNLACKIEEINCNYVNFFNENLLNGEYTKKQLFRKEFEVLKVLNFRVSSANIFHFMNIFNQITIQILSSNEYSDNLTLLDKNLFLFHYLKMSDLVLKKFIVLEESLKVLPIISAFICFKTSLLCLCSLMGINHNNTIILKINKQLEEVMSSKPSYIKCYHNTDQTAANLFSYLINNNYLNFQNGQKEKLPQQFSKLKEETILVEN
jgi:hypothetical protein